MQNSCVVLPPITMALQSLTCIVLFERIVERVLGGAAVLRLRQLADGSAVSIASRWWQIVKLGLVDKDLFVLQM